MYQECNKKHSIPKEIFRVFDKLKKLDFIEYVGFGRYLITSKKPGINIVGYDESTKSYIVNVKVKKYEQKLFLKVDSPNRTHKKRIESCF